ncbi:Odorant receptor 39 [Frankliniella occidentalis]|nr:uncharacterized protein LOC113211740 isoform X2 [Frankliniella occidentalis]KAE8743401.1 Odorant receptor 39 [Frankliniella occidentalis]
MKLSTYLTRLAKELCPPQRRLLSFAFKIIQGTKVSIVMTVIVSLLIAAASCTAVSYLEVSPNIRFISGLMAASVSQGVYVFRRQDVQEIVGCMASLAKQAEYSTHVDKGLTRVARRCMMLQRFFTIYSFLVAFTLLSPLASGGLPFPTWPHPDTWSYPHVTLAVVLVSQTIASVCAGFAYFTLWGLMLATQEACTALFVTIGTMVEEAVTPEDLLVCVRLQVRISTAATLLNRVTSDVMVFLLSAIMVVPIQATYEFLQGNVDFFLLLSCPIIFVVFVPLCYSGQDLTDASRRVGQKAYTADWVAGCPAYRRTCVLVMLRAARPALITCRGFGTMGLPFCKSALKSWFSYLNTLVGISS